MCDIRDIIITLQIDIKCEAISIVQIYVERE